jgi:hypothetical protein
VSYGKMVLLVGIAIKARGSKPVKVAKYAISKFFAEESALVCWDPYRIRQRARIIAKVNHRYLQRLISLELNFAIDKKTGTSFWRDAMNLEFNNVDVAFCDLETGDLIPVGHQHIKCHMIFDVKMGSLKRKSRYVAGGHMTEPLEAVTYASVVRH